MKMSEAMMVLTDAVSKGAKPLFTEYGQQAIANFLSDEEQLGNIIIKTRNKKAV